MKTRTRRAAFVVLGACATAACSFAVDLEGLTSPPSILAPAEAGEAGEAAVLVEASVDAPLDAPADAAPLPCLPSATIDTPLTTVLGPWTPRTIGNPGYPRTDSFFGAPAAVLFPFVDTSIDGGPSEHFSAVGGLWHAALPLRAFDIELEAHVRCTAADSCADGLGLVWLDTLDIPAATSVNNGHRMGLPSGVDGAGVLLDDLKNGADETDDPAAPSVQIVAIDASRAVGQYAWTVASKGTPFLAGWHSLTVSLRGDTVRVGYDGVFWIIGLVRPITRGVVGLTAATGGQTNAVAVRNLKGAFYDCTPL